MSTNQTTGFLGQNQTHYYSQGDQLGRCPQCYGNNISNVGTLNVDGTSRNISNCGNCNRLFTGANGGIQSLINEAQEQYKTQNVGFCSNEINLQAGQQMGGQTLQYTNGVGGLGYQGMQYTPPDNSYKIDITNQYLLTLQTQLSNLTAEIIRLANQNQELITKLATDPLVNIRKRVSDFNLE